MDLVFIPKFARKCFCVNTRLMISMKLVDLSELVYQNIAIVKKWSKFTTTDLFK